MTKWRIGGNLHITGSAEKQRNAWRKPAENAAISGVKMAAAGWRQLKAASTGKAGS